MLRSGAVLILILLTAAVLAIGSPHFLDLLNLFNILNQNAPLLIVASALTLVVIGGGFDLSTGAIFALSAVVSAKCAHDPFFIRWFGASACFLVGPMIGLGLGVINGVVITTLRVHSFLATLATALIFRGVAQQIAGGNSLTLFDLMPAIEWPIRPRIGLITIAFMTMAGFCVAMAIILSRTIFGRHVFAVGGNEDAAVLAGISPAKVRIGAFALVGLAAGLAGSIGLSRVLAAKASDGAGLEFDAIAAVILGGNSIYGGAGAVWRSWAGVILLALVNNGFNILQIDPFYKDIAKGLIILSSVAIGFRKRV
ncbi:ABC transporter permease [Gluconacetobacter sp. Hr-1-5]|uniref:ABC transporter permease n=1 Tax=Gluconacetobacter sp. Hr-1-5 TaxID=3395370 RepID=UPI003B52414F